MKSPLVLASKSLRDNRVCAPASHSPYTYRHQRAPYAALRRCPTLRPEFSVPRSSEDFPYSFDSPHKSGNIACDIVNATACSSRCFNDKIPHERLRTVITDTDRPVLFLLYRTANMRMHHFSTKTSPDGNEGLSKFRYRCV